MKPSREAVIRTPFLFLLLFSSGTVSFADPDDEIERLLVIAKQTLTEIKPATTRKLGEELSYCIAVSKGVKVRPC